MAIYWDPFFDTATNVLRMDQFFRDAGKTSWFTGLRQFGIRPPLTLVGSTAITEPAPQKLDRDQLKDKLVHWLDRGIVGIKPAARELSLLYVILTPGATELTLGNLSSKKDFGGYHEWDRYGISPIFTTENLVRDTNADGDRTSFQVGC